MCEAGSFSCAIIASLVLWFFPTLVRCQTVSPGGLLVATVRDESGAAIPEAEVRSEAYAAQTDPRGIARLTLPAGSHILTVARIGFRPATVQVDVIAGDEVRMAVTLEPTPYLLDSVTVLSTRT